MANTPEKTPYGRRVNIIDDEHSVARVPGYNLTTFPVVIRHGSIYHAGQHTIEPVNIFQRRIEQQNLRKLTVLREMRRQR